ncbi:MAG: adenosylcobinamide-GDP ribazoletransferase [Dehalococcoidia bacterium]|nr:adenosylcobinamide-GDP ribazoletransferase [Dehalococcoidia bacterium]
MNGFWAACQFLTVVPTPSGAAELASAVRWTPLIGALIGGALVGIDWALQPLLGPFTVAALLTVALATITGGLHLDGLADCADGLLAHRDPDGRRAIMKDPRIGSFGATAIALVLIAKAAALTELSGPTRLPSLMIAPALGRWAMVLQSRLFPPATPDGMGAAWRHGATWPVVIVNGVGLSVVAAIGLGAAAVVVMAVGVASALTIGWFATRQIHGVTGDVLGATVELAEAAALVALVAVARAAPTGWLP